MFYSYFILGFDSFWPLDYQDNWLCREVFGMHWVHLFCSDGVLFLHITVHGTISLSSWQLHLLHHTVFTLHVILLAFYFLGCAESWQKCILQNILALSRLNTFFLVSKTHKQRSSDFYLWSGVCGCSSNHLILTSGIKTPPGVFPLLPNLERQKCRKNEYGVNTALKAKKLNFFVTCVFRAACDPWGLYSVPKLCTYKYCIYFLHIKACVWNKFENLEWLKQSGIVLNN